MSYELELNKTNRLRLAEIFRHNKRVDYSIDCVVEGQMGRAFVDDCCRPTAFRITTGPFWYFAGDAKSRGGQALIAEFPAYSLLMPSPPGWLAAAQRVFQNRLVSLTRASFSAEQLSEGRLVDLYNSSPYRDGIVPLDAALITQLIAQPESYLDIAEFESPSDFLERGTGFAALQEGNILGVAYSSLVCSRGIEVSIYVEERYRKRGVATALSSRLLMDCKQRGRRPNWDAANAESIRLAKKLGYVFTGTYEAYYYRAG